MSKVLVTGNLGFIGSHLVDELLRQGHEVHGIDNLSTGTLDNLNPKCNFEKLDLCDKTALDEFMSRVKPETVFHLAALARIQPSIKDPVTWNENNANATLNLLWASHINGVRKLVFSGSSSVYGDNELPFTETQTPKPKNPYALSKAICEQWCKLFSDLYGLDVTVLRYFNVYGQRQVLEGDYATVIGIFIKQMQTGQPITIVGDGTQRRDLTYVKDVVAANIVASQTPGFGIYNVGTGTNHSIKDVAAMIQPDESKHQYGLVRSAEAKETLADVSNTERALNWRSQYTLKQGVNEVLAEGGRNE